MNESFKDLLVLQDRDIQRTEIDDQIKKNPLEVTACQKGIEAEKADLQSKRQKLMEMEAKSKQLEGDVKSIEDQIVKKQNQQLEVKKNEEYKALDVEMDLLREKTEEIEEEALTLLVEIDGAKLEFSSEEGKSKTKVSEAEKFIEILKNKQSELEKSLSGAVERYESALAKVSERFQRSYLQIKKQIKRFPFVIPLKGQVCTGCNLKVSNEVYDTASKYDALTHCDQCQRIVYRD